MRTENQGQILIDSVLHPTDGEKHISTLPYGGNLGSLARDQLVTTLEALTQAVSQLERELEAAEDRYSDLAMRIDHYEYQERELNTLPPHVRRVVKLKHLIQQALFPEP